MKVYIYIYSQHIFALIISLSQYMPIIGVRNEDVYLFTLFSVLFCR